MKHQKFSIQKTVKGFGYAFNGLKILITEESNAIIHFFAAICAVTAGIFLKVSATEWIAIVFAIGFVIALELVNSAIERLADFVSPGQDKMIKKIKDLSAAGVLVGAMTALVIGLIIFLPKILM
jgi:diacylglycerol kinase